jgi:hypothetical protein
VLITITACFAGCGETKNKQPADKQAQTSVTTGRTKTTIGKAELVDATESKGPDHVVVTVPIKHSTRPSEKSSHQVKRVSAHIEVSDGAGKKHVAMATTRNVYMGVGTTGGPDGNHTSTSDVVLRLSSDDSAAVKSAIEGGGSASIRSQADVATDTNGDGKSDGNDTAQSTTTASTLTKPAAKEKAVASMGASLGRTDESDDACGTYTGGNADNCTNVRGDKWASPSFLASHTWTLWCPADQSAVLTLPALSGGAPWHAVETNSHSWTSGASFVAKSRNGDAFGEQGADISITDYKLTDHPWHYTAILACSDNGQDWSKTGE